MFIKIIGFSNKLNNISNKYNFDIKDPISKNSKKSIGDYSLRRKRKFYSISKSLGLTREYTIDFEGVVNFIENQFFQVDSRKIKSWAKKFMKNEYCDLCKGSRLKKESQFFLIDNKSISEVNQMDISDLKIWVEFFTKSLIQKREKIAFEIINEISKRIEFIIDVGLDYLNLNRQTKSFRWRVSKN